MLGELHAAPEVSSCPYQSSLPCFRAKKDPFSFTRYSLYSQNVNLYLAPTADARNTWLPLLQTIALEGRTFVLSANQCVREADLPEWTNHGRLEAREGKENREAQNNNDNNTRNGTAAPDPSGNGQEADTPQASPQPNSHPPPFLSRGGSAIVSPTGSVLAGPLWEVSSSQEGEGDESDDSGLLLATVDFDDCVRGKLDFDAAGSYSRYDAFRLRVEGLDLRPPVG